MLSETSMIKNHTINSTKTKKTHKNKKPPLCKDEWANEIGRKQKQQENLKMVNSIFT